MGLGFAQPPVFAAHYARPPSGGRRRLTRQPSRPRRLRCDACAGRTPTTTPHLSVVTLEVAGLRCGSCVSRCEKLIVDALGDGARATAAADLLTGAVVVTSSGRQSDVVRKATAALMRGGFGATVRRAGAPPASLRGDALAGAGQLAIGVALLLASTAAQSLCCGPFAVRTSSMAVQLVSLLCVVCYIAFPLRPFFLAGLADLARGAMSMSALVLLSVSAQLAVSACGLSLPAVATPRVHETMLLLGFVHLGRVIDSGLRQYTTRTTAKSLSQLQPQACTRISADGSEATVGLEDVREGDHLLVRSGDRFPVDATLSHSASVEADFSAITGEALPVVVRSGETVWAGGVNLSERPVLVRAVTTGDASEVAAAVAVVQAALAEKARMHRLADVASAALGKLAILLAVSALAYYSTRTARLPVALRGHPSAGPLLIAASILSAACPCSLALAVPMIGLVAMCAAASQGILFRSGLALELAGSAFKLVALDKTGTLTTGTMDVVRVAVHPSAAISEQELVRLAASVEARAMHPIATGILRYAAAAGIDVSPGGDVLTVAGCGVVSSKVPLSSFGGESTGTVRVGSAQWIGEVDGPSSGSMTPAQASTTTGVLVHCAELGGVLGRIELRDELRASREDVSKLRRLKGRPKIAVLSGDSQPAVDGVAADLRIGTLARHGDVVRGGLRPRQKAHLLRQLAEGAGKGSVCAVGDGVNDGPMLASADIGFALGRSGEGVAPVAATAALVVVPRGNLDSVSEALAIGRMSRIGTLLSLAWAAIYNLGALARASGLGEYVPAHRAAMWMAASSAVSMLLPIAFALALQARKRLRAAAARDAARAGQPLP
jgi:heavy metal translocating P-type ATPase